MRHLPWHIDLLCGHYYKAVVANREARRVDQKHVAYDDSPNVYTMYRCHNYHFKIYAAIFLGQHQTALDTAKALIATISEDLLRLEQPPMAEHLEGLISMKLHVLIRFGQWQTIIDEALPLIKTYIAIPPPCCTMPKLWPMPPRAILRPQKLQAKWDRNKPCRRT